MPSSTRFRSLSGLAAALTAGAGLIHGVAAASHRGDEALGLAFAVTAVLQVGMAAALAARPRRSLLLASAGLNSAAAVAWLVSRWTGLPLVEGLAGAEAVGRQDLTSVLMEAAAAGAAVMAAGQPKSHVRSGTGRMSPAWALAALPALIGITAPHPHGEPGHAHSGDRPSTLASDPIFSGADTSHASEEQLGAARDLIVRTRAAVAGRLSDEASVVAAGYRSIGDGRAVGTFEHFVNISYLADQRRLDPDHIESIVLERTATGKRIVSAMYVLEMGATMADAPDIAGTMTAWHDHQDLCWDVAGMRLAGRQVNGRCVPAGTFVPTPPMLHVWLQDHRCGPFAGVDGHGGACATAHAHPAAAAAGR